MLPIVKKIKQPIYLDYAATTPVAPEVLKVMKPFWAQKFGNPSSLYKRGREAKLAVDKARKTIAALINARFQEIIFTAGGTESCNLAIFGVARQISTDIKTDKRGARPHIITTAIEHHAVLNPIEELKGRGYGVTVLGVGRDGLVSIGDLQKAIRPQTILVSVMYANNEIGTIEPIAEIGRRLSRINIERTKKGDPSIIFHTDACQAAGFLDINVQRLGVDLMSINASKIYGPKQVGFLFVRNGVNLKPIIYGGGQERDLRSGTENVAGVVGLAKALEISQKLRNKEIRKLGDLQKYFIAKLLKIRGVELNGPQFIDNHKKLARLPNNVNVTIPGVEGEALMLYLDGYGVEVSTGSACTTGLADPSHVLLAVGRNANEAKSSLRFSLGKFTTKKELNYVLKILPPLIKNLRKVTGLKS